MTSEINNKSKPYIVCCYCLADRQKHDKNYFLSAEQQDFEKMVKDTFNIQITYSKSENMICLKCVENILSAVEVKKKILNAQKVLMERCKDLFTLDSVCFPKEEVESVVDELEFDDSRGDDMEQTMSCDDDDDTFKMIKAKGNEQICIKKESSKPSRARKKRMNANHESLVTESEDLRHMKTNSIKLLSNSNMILFKSKRTAFGCYSCKKTFFDIHPLRDHSKTHPAKRKIVINLKKSLGLTYQNVDISDLTCIKCSSQCKDLSDLREHLATEHSEVFNGPEHLFVPFKLVEGFKCVICQATFNTFCRLSIHMNSHSNRNVCEKCGVSYTSRLGLYNHIKATHTEQKCLKCSIVFPNRTAKATHLRTVHNKIPRYKRYCLQCEMTFQYGYQLQEHMIKVHGAKRQTGTCQHCGKEFPSLTAVKIHIRGVHLGERKYPCSVCDTRYFTSHDRQRHERTHRSEKSFSCNICEMWFKSKCRILE